MSFERWLLLLFACLVRSCVGTKWQLPIGTGSAPFQTIVEWSEIFTALFEDEVEFSVTSVGSGASLDGLVGVVNCAKYATDPFLCGPNPTIEATPLSAGGGTFDADWYTKYADLDLQLLPALVGPIVVVYGKDVTGNLGSDTDAKLNLTLQAVADIFGGRSIYWDAPTIQALNPGIVLPHERINVIVRSDKSGMSESFTKAIGHFNPWWYEVPGYGAQAVGQKPKWPLANYSDPDDPHFIALEGMSAMAVQALRTPYSITYLDLAESRRFFEFLGSAHIVNNYTQKPVAVSVDSLMNAMDAYLDDFLTPGSTMAVDPLDPRRENAYPITRFIYWYIKKSALGNGDCYRAWMVSRFLAFTYSEGAQGTADKNGWALAPETVYSIIRNHLNDMKCFDPDTGAEGRVADYVPPRRRTCPEGQYIKARPGGEGIDAFIGCAPCPEGTYQPRSDAQQSFSCMSCPAGKANDQIGQSDCSPCSTGTAQGYQGAALCDDCAPGSVASKVGMTECTLCGLGTFAPTNGSVRCDFCDAGFFAGHEGASSCSSCQGGATTQERGAQSEAECGCAVGQYMAKLSGGGHACRECLDEGTICRGFGAGVLVAKGYFMPEDAHRDAERLDVFLCQSDIACPGQQTDGDPVCSAHRVGLNCAKCDDGYDGPPTGSLCDECTVGSRLVIPLLLLALIPTLAALHYYWNYGRAGQVEAVEGALMSLTVGTTLAFVQSLGLLGTMRVKWPSGLISVLDAFKVFLFDLSGLRAGCLVDINVWSTYGVNLAFPMVIVLSGMILVPLSMAIRRLTRGRSPYFSVAEVIGTIGLIVINLYVAVCSATVSLIDCYRGPNDTPVVRSMPFLECRGPEFEQAIPLFVLGVLIYMVVVTSLLIWVLFVAPARLKDASFRAATRFLLFKFRPGAWWFNLPLNVRSFAMSMVTVVFPDDATNQSLLMIFIIGISLWAQCAYVPYTDGFANSLELLELYGLAALVVIGAAGENGDDTVKSILSVGIFSIVAVGCVVINGWAFFLASRPKFAHQRQRARAVERVEDFKRVADVVSAIHRNELIDAFVLGGTHFELSSVQVVSDWLLHLFEEAKPPSIRRSRSELSWSERRNSSFGTSEAEGTPRTVKTAASSAGSCIGPELSWN